MKLSDSDKRLLAEEIMKEIIFDGPEWEIGDVNDRIYNAMLSFSDKLREMEERELINNPLVKEIAIEFWARTDSISYKVGNSRWDDFKEYKKITTKS